MDATMLDTLFAPVNSERLRLSNRLAVAPMTRISATHEGFATPSMASYYARFASGGFGLVITEGAYTDQAYSQGYAGQPALSDDDQARSWRPVVDAVHRRGGRIFAQLMHAGALSQSNRFRRETVAPSALRPKGRQLAMYGGQGEYPAPRSMTDEEIAEAVEGFAAAARRAREIAGFDGIEVHGANGYLLDQFLTATTNRRSDRYGGTVKERIALTIAVVEAVRRSVGGRLPVGVRVSQAKVNDFDHKWPDGERDAEAIFGRLGECDLDYIHVTEFEAWRPAFASGEASLATLARRFAPRLAVIANGGLHEPRHARAMLTNDAADIVALGKGALANPDWPNRVAAGMDIKPFDPATLKPLARLSAAEMAMDMAENERTPLPRRPAKVSKGTAEI
jgi:2,4-dienoyl-CoA reductase-like NADH-dependent reductase (Old Yellow Enzyme family)